MVRCEAGANQKPETGNRKSEIGIQNILFPSEAKAEETAACPLSVRDATVVHRCSSESETS